MHSRHDARETIEAARRASAAALRERLLNDVDPDRTLDEAERERRYEYAYRTHWQGLNVLRWKRAREQSGG